MKRTAGKEIDPSSLVIDVIEKEVLPRLQSGEETYLVVAQKRPEIMKLPSLPGVFSRTNSSAAPIIHEPDTALKRWHRAGNLGFVYIIRGEAELLLSNRFVTCKAGNFTFFLPHTWSDLGSTARWKRSNSAEARCDFLWLYLTPREVLCHASWLRGGENNGNQHLFIPENRLTALVELLQEEILQGAVTESATQLIWFIYNRVLDKLRKGNFLSSRLTAHELFHSGEAESIGQRAQNYVDANLMQRMTLESVARAVLISRARLAREFKSHTGETFGDYLLRCRIERAQLLLTTTSDSIRVIAWRVGFTDPDYFSTTFRRIIGITPTEFRKKIR